MKDEAKAEKFRYDADLFNADRLELFARLHDFQAAKQRYVASLRQCLPIGASVRSPGGWTGTVAQYVVPEGNEIMVCPDEPDHAALKFWVKTRSGLVMVNIEHLEFPATPNNALPLAPEL